MGTSVGSESVGPPVWPVLLLATASLGSIVLAVLASITPAAALAGAGYGLGALLSVAFLSTYRALRNARRGGSFRPSRGLDRLVLVLTVAGFATGIYCAYLLATELAK